MTMSMHSQKEIINQVIAHLQNGDALEAINKCKYILAINPSDQNALYFSSISFKILGNPFPAITFAERISVIGNISENSYKKIKEISHWSVERAREFIESDEYAKAWSICNSAIKIDQDNTYAIATISYCEAVSGNTLKSLKWIPDNSPITKEVAEVCNFAITASNKMLECGNMEGFAVLISEILRIIPNNEGISRKLHEVTSTILTKAIEFHQSGLLEKAEADYNFILSVSTENDIKNHVIFLKSLLRGRKEINRRKPFLIKKLF